MIIWQSSRCSLIGLWNDEPRKIRVGYTNGKWTRAGLARRGARRRRARRPRRPGRAACRRAASAPPAPPPCPRARPAPRRPRRPPRAATTPAAWPPARSTRWARTTPRPTTAPPRTTCTPTDITQQCLHPATLTIRILCAFKVDKNILSAYQFRALS